MTVTVALDLYYLQVLGESFYLFIDILKPSLLLKEDRQTPVKRLYPDIAITVLHHCFYLSWRKVGMGRRIAMEGLKMAAVVAAKTVHSTKPQESVFGFYYTVNDIIRKPFHFRIMSHDDVVIVGC